jgi:hypothetical protein
MARINAHLGTKAVTALRFVQTVSQALPASAVAHTLDPARLAEIEGKVAGMPDGELRSALSALGRAIAGSELLRKH